MIIAVLVVSLLTAIIVAISVVLSNDDTNSIPPEQQNTNETDIEFVPTPLFQYLSRYSSPLAISMPSDTQPSPQWQTYDWLSTKPPFNESYYIDALDESLDPYELLQLFVFATLYFSTNGDDWIFNRDSEIAWLQDTDICQTWKFRDGFTSSTPRCQDDGITVETIILASNNLTGTIPTELGLLTRLMRLQFPRNRGIGGTIPSELGSLTSLFFLELSANILTSTIPTELGLLTNLRKCGLQLELPTSSTHCA